MHFLTKQSPIMTKSISSIWIPKSLLLLMAMSVISSAAFGQAQFWSIFGINGCSSSDYNHSMSCAVSPSTSPFININAMTNLTFITSSLPPVLANSSYDGYVVLDISHEVSKDAADLLRHVKETIKVRLVY